MTLRAALLSILPAVWLCGTAQAQSDAGPTCDGADEERCDCQDNDYDGETDEAGSCYTAGAYCSAAFCNCLLPCRPLPANGSGHRCGIGEACVAYPTGKFCEPQMCRENSCGWDEYCEQLPGGVLNCRRICDDIVCGPCETCEGRQCVTSCGAGEVCVDGACAARNCGEAHCAPPQICCDGACVDPGECSPADSGAGDGPAASVTPQGADCGCRIGHPAPGLPLWLLLGAGLALAWRGARTPVGARRSRSRSPTP